MARDATAFRLVQAGALVGCLMLPGLARAQGAAQQDDPQITACHGAASTMDIVNYLGRLTARRDTRLNAAYQAAVKAAAGGAEPSLRGAERAWLEYRRQRCAYVSAVPGTIDQVLAADCMLEMTKARAEELATDLRGVGE